MLVMAWAAWTGVTNSPGFNDGAMPTGAGGVTPEVGGRSGFLTGAGCCLCLFLFFDIYRPFST